jgi:FG-GAP-like repeat
MANQLSGEIGATVANTADYSAAIDWGDATSLSSFTVTNATPSLTPQGLSFAVNAHLPFSADVATFSDSHTFDVPSDFTAQIDWGDGQTTSASVEGGNGSFTVLGGHTYATPGQDTPKVTLTYSAGFVAVSATATSTAFVNTTPFDFDGDGISDLVFQDQDPAVTDPGAAALFRWDGSTVTSEAFYGQVGLSWHIVTGRDLNGDGHADLIWQNTDGTPGVWLMNGATPIAEAGLANPGPSWRLVAAGDTNGDGNADFIWQNADGTLGVWLMNGTTPLAEAGIGNPGSNWKVIGTADFLQNGHDDILLQDKTTGNLMIDLMNGTTVTSSVSIAVGDPSWHAVSTGVFNGRAEIAWQNDSGQVGLWLMNGTSPVAEVGLANLGSVEQLVSIDHFTPDGHGDLLLQNSMNGEMVLWKMNGTIVTAMGGVPAPGVGPSPRQIGWQSENGHPFAQG